MQLRAHDGRAVLADSTHEVDPHAIALGADLADSLHEWARVAQALERAGHNDGGVSAGLVSRRGRQLAARVAAAMGGPVSYVDPLTGAVTDVAEPEPMATGGPRHQASEPIPEEPTPWATGLTVSGVAAVIMTVAVVALSTALGGVNGWLEVIANLVIALGLTPSLMLARRIPVWRWVAYGVAAGILVAWIGLVLSLL